MAKIYFGMYAEFIVGASHGNEKANDELIGRFDVNREESRRGLRLVVAVMAAATAPLPDRIHPRGELTVRTSHGHEFTTPLVVVLHFSNDRVRSSLHRHSGLLRASSRHPNSARPAAVRSAQVFD